MSLPTYNRNNRRKSFTQLPKGAYVVKIIGAELAKWPSGDEYIKIGFDIAEGEHKGFYKKQYDTMPEPADGNKKAWPYDAVFNLNVPTDSSPDYVQQSYDTFFADLEDSNNGFVFNGDLKTLKNKIIGGKFHNKQTEKNGTVYDHIVMKWTCIADDVRSGNPGKMPNDKLVEGSRRTSNNSSGDDDFMNIDDGIDDEVPFL